ncbi:hypothetical protein O181_039448 [Austropuccinia psidii MF-1]|uniref:Uncharacterized protein n=1 Tax=Austropuccinia psidii MF-1 TaxID=1389203 RepID=A0A9Q3HBZ8_9BASI|nr:hypothetical protein [Austropuccinia psidii MF-1]
MNLISDLFSSFSIIIRQTVTLGINIGLLICYRKGLKQHSSRQNLALFTLMIISMIYSLICQYAIWSWFVQPLDSDKKSTLWPHAASPIFSGILIWGVELILTHRAYIISERKNRIIPVLLVCLAFAQLVFCACRSMEILGMKKFSLPYSEFYMYPFWISFVSVTDIVICLFSFHVLNRTQFCFDHSKNICTRFIILAPQIHLLAALLSQTNLGLFLLRKDGTYLIIDLCLGNCHLFSMLNAIYITRIDENNLADKRASGSRKSRNITITDLSINIPMNPLSARLSRNRLSADWAETFVNGMETTSRAGSEPTIKESSSSAASFSGSRSSNLKAFRPIR